MSKRRYTIMRSDFSGYLTSGGKRYIFTEDRLDLARKAAQNYCGFVVPEKLCDWLLTDKRRVRSLQKTLTVSKGE